MAQQLRSLAVLLEDPTLFPSTKVGDLIMTSASRSILALLASVGNRTQIAHTYIDTDAFTYPSILKGKKTNPLVHR